MTQKIKEGIDSVLERNDLPRNTEIEIKELHVLAQKNSLDGLPLDKEPTKRDLMLMKHTLGERGHGHAEIYHQDQKIGDIEFPVEKGRDTGYDLADAIAKLNQTTEKLNQLGYSIMYDPNKLSNRQHILEMTAFHLHGSLPLDGETAKTLVDAVYELKDEVKQAIEEGKLKEYGVEQKRKFDAWVKGNKDKTN